MIFSALLAKFLSAGAVAQAATGATVAVVAFTGVGAAGALPDPVQDTFATVVAAVTPLEAPTSDESTEEVVTEEKLAEEVGTTDEATEVVEDADVVDVQAWIEAGPEDAETFGAWVNASANDPDLRAALLASGQNFGSVISEWAVKKGLDEQDLLDEGVDLDALIEEDATETESDLSDDAVETATETEETEGTRAGATVEDRGSRGNGNVNGKTTGGDGNGRGNARN